MDKVGTIEIAVTWSVSHHDSRAVNCPRAQSWRLQESTGEIRASYLEHPREGGSAKLGIVGVVVQVALVGRLDPIFECFKSTLSLVPEGVVISVCNCWQCPVKLGWVGLGCLLPVDSSKPLGEWVILGRVATFKKKIIILLAS